MMVEAIRAHLVSLGVVEAEHWTHEQIMDHVDTTFLRCVDEDPESFNEVADDFWINVKTNMNTVNKVLTEGLQA